MPDAVRWARRRLASLLTEIRRAVASPASVLVRVAVIIGNLVPHSKVRVIKIYVEVLADLTYTDRSHGSKRPVLASRF
jgi:hypothetical protein